MAGGTRQVKVLIQWATHTPHGWSEYDIDTLADARRLPRKPVPSDRPEVDEEEGWFAAAKIGDTVFTGYDHLGFRREQEGLIVVTWNDDPEQYPPGMRWGQEWWFNRYFTGTMWYGEPGSTPHRLGVPRVRPWSEFVPSRANATLHGIWMPDARWAAHAALAV